MDRDALAAVPEAAPQASAPASGVRRSSFRALRSKPFSIFFAGQAISASGTFVQQTAIGWLVLKLTGSASDLGLVLAAGGIPNLLLGPWGGTVADRVNIRKLLIVTETTYGVLAAALWLVALEGNATVPAIVVISVLSGFVQIVDSPARQAFVSQLVKPEDLSSAVSLNGVVMNSSRVVGPAIAGVLIVTLGTTPCFLVNAASYIGVVGALLILRPLSTAARAAKHTDSVRAGLHYARGHQQLWLPLVMMALVGLLAFNFTVILPVLAKDTFHGDGGTYGLFSTVLSVGSVAGSLLVGVVPHPKRKYLMVASIAFGVWLIATAAAPSVVVVCITLAGTGAAAFAFVTLCSTSLQLHASPAYRGRILALWVFVYIGTTPIGTIITGQVTSALGPRAALLVGAASCLVAGGLASLVHTPPRPDPTLRSG
jgi:predicted MFS family arabinose efflux permease